MIELTGVSLFTPEGIHILKSIDWHIKPGENWVLFGRNGAGKTKLLDILAGYSYPSKGTIRRFSLGQGDADLRELRKRIGFISSTLKNRLPQQDTLIEIILSGTSASIGLFEEPDNSDKSFAAHLLELTGLGNRGNDSFGILSDGEKQKVLMARAMINAPDILILDEPAAGLDLKNREDLLSGLSKISILDKTSIIYVTHHPEEIIPVFEKILMLKKGEVCFNGAIEKGLSKATLKEMFGSNVSLDVINNRYYCRITE